MKSPSRTTHATRTKLLFAAALIACMIAYWPGLNGGFAFDDYPNIVQNQRLAAIEDITPRSILSAISQAEPGPIGRPISFISFAINAALSGLNPYYFKLTNLVIHLLNGILLFGLIRILLTRLDTQVTPSERDFVALATTAAWLLHPINLTSVLYIVQRMTELSALFVFLSLILYAAARSRQIEGQPGAPLRFFLMPLTFLLALFSKETGILVIVYLFLVELIVFRFKAQSSTTSRRLRQVYLGLACIVIPTGLFMLYHFSFGYGHREFTLAERLQSEGRILWFYIQSILLPDIRSMGLFHDDFEISRGLFTPPQTLFSLLGLCALLIAAAWLRNKAQILTFGVLFFFSTHLLESTVIPLELIHEHRNYIGSWALLLPASYYLMLLGKRYGAEIASYSLVGLLIIALGINTYTRSWYWGDELRLASYQAYHHPNSYRSMLAAGSAFSSRALGPETEARLKNALEYYLRAYKQKPQESKALVSIVSILDRLDDKNGMDIYSQRLLEALREESVSTETENAFIVTSQCVGDNQCHFPFDIYREMSRALLSNPFTKNNSGFSAKVYSANSNIAYLDGNIDLAIAYGEKSVTLDPSEPQYYLNQTILMISLQEFDKARRYLKQVRAIEKTLFIEKKISQVENMLKQHETIAKKQD